jgi:hypothetical protein
VLTETSSTARPSGSSGAERRRTRQAAVDRDAVACDVVPPLLLADVMTCTRLRWPATRRQSVRRRCRRSCGVWVGIFARRHARLIACCAADSFIEEV